MASEYQLSKSESLVIHSVTVQWRIKKLEELNFDYHRSRTFRFDDFEGKFIVQLRSNGVLNIGLSKISESIFFTDLCFKACLVDRNDSMQYEKNNNFPRGPGFIIIASWNLEELRNVFNNNPVTIRCHISMKEDAKTRRISTLTRSFQTLGQSSNSQDQAIQTDNIFFDEIDKGSALSNDFEKLYNDNTCTDCVLKVGDRSFPAHRAVLSARSTVFAAMFSHDTSESRNGEVNISDIQEDTLNNVLYYVFTDKIRGLTEENATKMFTAADKYAFLELRNRCLKFLMCHLTTENVGDAALLAHTHGEEELENLIAAFMDDNFNEVMASESWQRFLAAKPLIASRFLTQAFRYSKTRNK